MTASALSAITASTDLRRKRDPSLVGNRGGRRDEVSLLPANLTRRPCKAPRGRGLQQLEHLFITNSPSSRYETRVQDHLQPFEWAKIRGFTLCPCQGAASWQKLQDRCMALHTPLLADAKASLPPTGQH